MRDRDGDGYFEGVAPVAAAGGEPWHALLAPTQVAELVTRHGFAVVAEAGQRDQVSAELWARSDAPRPIALCRIVRAVRTGRPGDR